ncbi:MAG: hypothetical protein ACFFB0_20325 [Promethearchaeota archaeon]
MEQCFNLKEIVEWKYIEVDQIQLNSKNNQVEELTSNTSDVSVKFKGKFRKYYLYTKCFIPIFLRHHPECNKFEGHTIKFRGKEFCIGCFIGYPTALLALPLLIFFRINELIPSHFLLLVSVIFIGTFFLSPLNLIRNKKVKIVQKFLIGLGAALLLIWIMELPYPKSLNSIIAFIIFNILIVILNLYHAYGILHTCYNCETPFDWGKCSGFCTIRDRMEKNNLNNFLLDLENFSIKILEKRTLKREKKR